MHHALIDRPFIWAGGIEDTFIPQTRRGFRALDEYELMGHYQHWREDLALARELGLQALRWGVPWYRLEPQEGKFDWGWTDQVLPYLVEELGITPIIDLVHYGCPLWLERGFDNPDYPSAVAAFAAAFARKYSSLIQWYTPFNEPSMTALMCGRQGIWPPYLRGDRGYVRVMVQAVRGIVRTVEALKSVDPGAVMVQVEAASIRTPGHEDLEALAREELHRTRLSYDLLHGLITPDHPLFLWLVRNGASPGQLAEIVGARIPIDVMGLNFYPQWSAKQVHLDRRGRIVYKMPDKSGAGFERLIEDHYQRYGQPIMVTETSAVGSDSERVQWFERSLAAVRSLRERGLPVLGYTWFPLFTMIDWRYRSGTRPVEHYRLDLGLYSLAEEGTGSRWRPTPLVERLQHAIRHSNELVGPLATD